MAIFNVTITDADQTNGVGPVRVEAATPELAVEKVAADEGMTLAQFIAAGLTVRLVEAV